MWTVCFQSPCLQPASDHALPAYVPPKLPRALGTNLNSLPCSQDPSQSISSLTSQHPIHDSTPQPLLFYFPRTCYVRVVGGGQGGFVIMIPSAWNVLPHLILLLPPFFHFHPLQLNLDVSRLLQAESSTSLGLPEPPVHPNHNPDHNTLRIPVTLSVYQTM